MPRRSSTSTVIAAAQGVELFELTAAIPPVDDLSKSIAIDDGRARFYFGDGGEERMTRALWEHALDDGLDEETRALVSAAGIGPERIAGPLAASAGLAFMRNGAFYAVGARPGSTSERWLGGTILVGGHGDRVLRRDVELDPAAGEVRIECFICEGHHPSRGSRSLRAAPEYLAPPQLRALAAGNDQFALWTRIAHFCHRFSPRSRSLREAMQSPGIESLVRERLPALVATVTARPAPGAVMLVKGRPFAADFFASPEDWRLHAAPILRSYVIGAMMLAGAHDVGDLEVATLSSRPGKLALATLMTKSSQPAPKPAWHTFVGGEEVGA